MIGRNAQVPRNAGSLAHGHPSAPAPSGKLARELTLVPAALAGIGSTALLAVLAFMGFEHLVHISEAMKDQRRTLLRALFITLGLRLRVVPEARHVAGGIYAGATHAGGARPIRKARVAA